MHGAIPQLTLIRLHGTVLSESQDNCNSITVMVSPHLLNFQSGRFPRGFPSKFSIH